MVFLDQLVGSARILSGGSFAFNVGNISTVVRSGLGVYVITLNPEADANEHVFEVQLLASNSDISQAIEINSDSQITVRSVVASTGVAVDSEYYLRVKRVRVAG